MRAVIREGEGQIAGGEDAKQLLLEYGPDR